MGSTFLMNCIPSISVWCHCPLPLNKPSSPYENFGYIRHKTPLFTLSVGGGLPQLRTLNVQLHFSLSQCEVTSKYFAFSANFRPPPPGKNTLYAPNHTDICVSYSTYNAARMRAKCTFVLFVSILLSYFEVLTQ